MLDNRILTFLTVCKEMNYTRAAEQLHITQPAVSQHIQYIEEYYGVKLFTFSGKKMSLTKEGKLLETSLTAFHNNEIYLKEQLSSMADKKKTVHFGTTLTVGEFMIARPLSRFLQRHPNADVLSRSQTPRSFWRSLTVAISILRFSKVTTLRRFMHISHMSWKTLSPYAVKAIPLKKSPKAFMT